jgi:hypothetical protein
MWNSRSNGIDNVAASIYGNVFDKYAIELLEQVGAVEGTYHQPISWLVVVRETIPSRRRCHSCPKEVGCGYGFASSDH